MNGKLNAIGMTLLMIASALAGCTSGDPDGDGEMGIDAELLDQLIQDNLQDFINNTTVTVNQDTIHYSNETHYTYNTYNGSSDYAIQYVATGVDPGVSTTQGETSNHSDMVLLIRSDRFHEQTAGGSWVGLDGANICVGIGTTTEGMLHDAFSNVGIGFTSVPIGDFAEGVSKFIDGSCDAITGSRNAIEIAQSDINGSGISSWISNAYASGASYFAIQSQFEYTLTQDYGQTITIVGAHFEVTLTGTCVQNCDADDEDTIQVFVFDRSPIHQYGPGSSYYDMVSICDIDGYGELTYENYEGFLRLPGLNCSTTIHVHAHIWGDNPDYEYTWSDWAYYVSWTESEVTMED